MIQQDSLVKTLQDIVRIPSHENCIQISKHVAREIRNLGINPDVDADGNIIATIGSGQGLLLNAHMDTVGITNYNSAFSGEIKDNRVYGRGSTDDKSGVAAMLELMKVLKKNPPKKKIIFAFTVGEECGNEETDGAYKVVKKVKATHCIVFEGSTKEEDGKLRIATGCKGRFVYNIDVLGKATHSGTPQKGINPIYLASKLIERLKNLATVSMEIEGVGKIQSIFSITQIEAKEGTNVIPGKCTLTLDYRALPSEKEPDVRKRVEKIFSDVLGDSYKITNVGSRDGFLQTDPEFNKLVTTAIKESGAKRELIFGLGWFDGAVFDSAGIKTFNIGPGTVGQAHRNPEYCYIPGLIKGTQTILNIIRKWDES